MFVGSLTSPLWGVQVLLLIIYLHILYITCGFSMQVFEFELVFRYASHIFVLENLSGERCGWC